MHCSFYSQIAVFVLSKSIIKLIGDIKPVIDTDESNLQAIIDLLLVVF